MKNYHIPFLDLQRQYKKIRPEINQAIQRVFRRQFFILGEELAQFEKEFAAYLGIRYTVGVASGTDGLMLALWALDIGKGDEIITHANGYVATAIAISRVGAAPILVDCDPDTYQIDTRQVEKRITKKTKAILAIHLYGAPFNVNTLQKIAKKNKLYLIEDACQAHGGMYKNKKLGTFGDLGVFSFYPSKNLGAYGDGGAVVVNKKDLYETLVKLRNYGQSKKYYNDRIGINSRLDEIHAAILRVKLKYIDLWNRKRNKIANMYKQELHESVKVQTIIEDGTSNYHLFVIETAKRDRLQKFLGENGIGTQIHYPVPIHLQKCYQNLGYKPGDFPMSERAARHILSLPMFPELTADEILYVTQVLKEFYSG